MMMNNYTLFSLFAIFLFPPSGFTQDSLLMRLASENVNLFVPQNGGFTGEGWNYIANKVDLSTHVLIGEDHFSNEIPAFIKAIAKHTKFDNFYIELDPFSTEIIAKTFRNFSEEERKKFNKTYGGLFSFYALKPEYELLEMMMDSGSNLLGSDQIVMYADRLIFQDILDETKSPEAREIFENMIAQSIVHLEKFYEDPKNPMYFMTPDFTMQLDLLEKLDLSAKEYLIIRNMRRSVTIYKEQNHRDRVQLMLHQLMNDFQKWNTSKTLFKYGANHMARGESFLHVYDIGNMVANIATSNYQESFHLMIAGESGKVGSPFKDFPDSPIDIENGFYLSYLKPFFKITSGDQWHMFNMIPLRETVEQNKLQIDNLNLLRVVKGFDVLVIIPELSPAKF